MYDLNNEEKAVNYQTMRHIERVRNLLNEVLKEILDRGKLHDQSKLEFPEVKGFTEFTKELAGSTYGSEEYEELKTKLAETLKHHYSHNRHHPEHFKNGINDMNLIDLIELMCDWKAASERHNDGNIRKSIEINAERFEISPQLRRIFENTADFLDGK